MANKIAFLSDGKLFVKEPETDARRIESEFAQDVINRALQRNNKHQWKVGGGEDENFGQRNRLWGVSAEDPTLMRINIVTVTPGGKDNELLYALDTQTVGGLFTYDVGQNKEKRIFHREGLFIRDLDKHPLHEDMVVCSQRQKNGTASIALCERAGVQSITEGDCVDEAPTWVPNQKKQVVYQSAGLARSQSGAYVGQGPSAVQKLDLETGEMTTLLEDAGFDFMSPHLTAGGDLYFIRRPYEVGGRVNYPPTRILLDVLLFPFRLIRAIALYLNFFSMIYSKKPLITATGTKMDGLDMKNVFLRGRMINAEEMLKDAARSDEPPSLVPETWQLVKKTATGAEEILVKGALAYDLDAQGNIVYSNGMAVYELQADGGRKLLTKSGQVIENLVVFA